MQLNQHEKTINHLKSKEINTKNVRIFLFETIFYHPNRKCVKKLEEKQVSRQFQSLLNSLRYLKVNNLSKKMRSHKFINSLLYLIIPLVAKESRANENNGGIKCFFALFIDKRYIFQVIHFNSKNIM